MQNEAPPSDPALSHPGCVFADHDHGSCTDAVLDVAARLESKGLRLTPVRQKTLEILLESHKAMGAYDVLERLAAEGFGKQPPVAYRALDFLVEHGLAHRVQRLNAFTACLHPDQPHQPAFLICRQCNKVAEAPAQKLRPALDKAAAEAGFFVEQTTIEALGLCVGCARSG